MITLKIILGVTALSVRFMLVASLILWAAFAASVAASNADLKRRVIESEARLKKARRS